MTRPHSRHPLALSAILTLLFACPPSSTGAVVYTTTGNVDPADPSKWTSGTDAYIGKTTAGTLTFTAGTIFSSSAYLGYNSGVSGYVAISGASSKWNNDNLFAGYSGSGTLNVTGGGSVSTFSARIADNSGSTGVVTVEGDGSTWTNTSHFWVGRYGSGTLNVMCGGSVSNPSAKIGLNSGSTGVVTVDGARSTWTNGYTLFVGISGSGILNVTHSGSVSNSEGRIAEDSGSAGVVTVEGDGSTWTNAGKLSVGISGNGTLNVTHRGSVGSAEGSIGGLSGSTGIVAVDGNGSTWTNTDNLYVGSYGNGTLNVTHGGSVGSAEGHIGRFSGSTSVVTVDGVNSTNGASSTWTNTGSLSVGYQGAGTLNVTGGGAVTATSVSIYSSSLLAIDVGRNSSLTVSGGTSNTISNSGTVRILAGAGVVAGTSYSPIIAGKWAGSGTYQPIGGTWDTDGHTFSASAVQEIEPGKPTNVVLSSFQRIIVNDVGPDGKPWSVGASFAPSSNTATVTASAIDSDALALLKSALLKSSPNEGLAVLNAFEFSINGVTISSSNPAYLSFDIGSGFSRNDLDIWHYTDGAWSEYDVSDLTYDNTYVSFTATSFSSYAVVAPVPEPGTLAMLLAASLTLAAYIRRRTR